MQFFRQRERRLQQVLHLAHLAQAGELQKHRVGVLADGLVGGEQAVIGIQPRGARVVVAGGQMRVVFEAGVLAPHHQDHFGVRLVADHAVDHVRAGVLQFFRQVDVGLFVEARAQFDHHRDFLAVARRLEQGVHHAGLGAGAVQRLFDGQHVGIARRLAQEFDHRRERIERVMQQNVALANRREQVGAGLQRLGQARRERRVLEFRTINQVRDRQQAVQIHRAVDLVHVLRLELEHVHQVLPHLLGAVVRHFQPHGVTPLTLRQFALQRHHQILGFLLVHQQVAVASDAELITAGGLHPRKQIVHVRVNHRRQEHKIIRARARDVGRQPDQSRQRAWRLHHRKAGVAAKRVLARQRGDEVQRLVEDARKRMRRVQPQGGQHRHQLGFKIIAQPDVLFLAAVGAAHEADFFLLQRRHQHLVEHAVLLVHQRVRALRNGRHQIGRQYAVGPGLSRSHAQHLLQPGDADFKKLVEIGAGNAQEFQPLQQRDVLVLAQLQHAPVEFQQRQLAVQEQLRGGEFGWSDAVFGSHGEKLNEVKCER